jgi:hypothetical protein
LAYWRLPVLILFNTIVINMQIETGSDTPPYVLEFSIVENPEYQGHPSRRVYKQSDRFTGDNS